MLKIGERAMNRGKEDDLQVSVFATKINLDYSVSAIVIDLWVAIIC